MAFCGGNDGAPHTGTAAWSHRAAAAYATGNFGNAAAAAAAAAAPLKPGLRLGECPSGLGALLLARGPTGRPCQVARAALRLLGTVPVTRHETNLQAVQVFLPGLRFCKCPD